jgi:hypothetical protein
MAQDRDDNPRPRMMMSNQVQRPVDLFANMSVPKPIPRCYQDSYFAVANPGICGSMGGRRRRRKTRKTK